MAEHSGTKMTLSDVMAATRASDGTMDATDTSGAGSILSPQKLPAPGDEAMPVEERYDPVGLLGEGGMGEVYRVRDVMIGRDVALKSLRPDRAENVASRDRFLREIRIQGQLEHPSIVPVYDLGARQGVPWF